MNDRPRFSRETGFFVESWESWGFIGRGGVGGRVVSQGSFRAGAGS